MLCCIFVDLALFLTYDDEVDGDLLAAESVGALARVLSGVFLVDVGDLEGLLGGPEALPRIGADALAALGPIDHGRGVAAHRAGDAGVGPEAHHLRHVLLTRRGRPWKTDRETKKLNMTLEIVDIVIVCAPMHIYM